MNKTKKKLRSTYVRIYSIRRKPSDQRNGEMNNSRIVNLKGPQGDI